MKRPKIFQPYLKTKRDRVLFLMINIYLFIGMLALSITLIYLLTNLDHSDFIIKNCIPGIVMGISSAIIYFVGYQSLITDHGSK